MPDVKHMKWWGWGVEGVGFHHEDKPAFRPFVLNAIDLDVNTTPTTPMALDDLAGEPWPWSGGRAAST